VKKVQHRPAVCLAKMSQLTMTCLLASTVLSSTVSGTTYIVGERGFTKEAIGNMSGKKGEQLNGRNIHDRALMCIAMFRLAMKYHNEFCKDGKLPSGKSIEDLLLYVRQKMYVHLKGARNNKSNARVKTVDKEGNEIVLSEEDLPDKWIFHGWFVFVLFCPQGMSACSLSCLSDDGSDVPKQSRAEARAKEAKVKTEERRANESGNRGISGQDQVALASLEHATFKEETKNVRDLIYYLTIEEGNQMKALESVYNLIEKADTDFEKKLLQKRKSEILERIVEVTDRKQKLEAESDSLREEATNKKKQRTVISTFQEEMPRQVSIEKDGDATTQTSSVTLSGSSSKKSRSLLSSSTPNDEMQGTQTGRRADKPINLDDSEKDNDDQDSADDDNDDGSENGNNNHCQQPNSDSDNDSPKRPISKTERELDAQGQAVMAQFRAKQAMQGNKQPDYGLDYMY
jgi:hypothetical protein